MTNNINKFNELADNLTKSLRNDPSYKNIDHAMTELFSLMKSSYSSKRINNKVSEAISNYIQFYGDYGIRNRASEIQQKQFSVFTDHKFESDFNLKVSAQEIDRDTRLLQQAKQSKSLWFDGSAYTVSPLSAKAAIDAIQAAKRGLSKIPDKMTNAQFIKELQLWQHKLAKHPTKQNASNALEYLSQVDAEDLCPRLSSNVDIAGIIYDSNISNKNVVIDNVKQMLADDMEEAGSSKSDAKDDKQAIASLRGSSYKWYIDGTPYKPVSAQKARDVVSNILDHIHVSLSVN